MNRRYEQQARSRLVNAYFDSVAQESHIKDKWISCNLFYEFIRRKAGNDELIFSLSSEKIKMMLLRSGRFAENNIAQASLMGYYYRQLKKRKMVDDKSQTVLHQAFLVTGKGQLPPVSNTPWYTTVITDISHLYPQADVPSYPIVHNTTPTAPAPNIDTAPTAFAPTTSTPNIDTAHTTSAPNIGTAPTVFAPTTSAPNIDTAPTASVPNNSIPQVITPPQHTACTNFRAPHIFSDYFFSTEARNLFGYH